MKRNPNLIEIEPLVPGYAHNQILGLFQDKEGISYTSQLTEHELYELLQEMITYLHRKIHG